MGKRLNGEGSIVFVDRRGEYQVRISIDGKRITKYYKDEKDAVNGLQELRRKYGLIKFDKNITLGDWYEEWLFNIKFNEVSPRTVQRYHGTFKKHIQPYGISKMKISEITKYDVTKLFSMLLKDDRSKQQIKETRLCLAICFNAADEFIERNPCRNVQIPKNARDNSRTHKNINNTGVKDEGEYNAFTQNEQKKVMEYLLSNQNNFKEKVICSALIFALGTGLRSGELMALDYKRDFDKDYTRIKVTMNLQLIPVYDPETLKVTEYKRILVEPKTGSSVRDVFIPESLTEYLKTYITELKKYSLQDEYFENKNILFPNELGDYMDRKILRRRLKTITEKLKISDINVHGLRHSYATRLLESGVGMDVISKLLGHSSLDITQNIYAHVLEDRKKSQLEMAGDFIGLK